MIPWQHAVLNGTTKQPYTRGLDSTTKTCAPAPPSLKRNAKECMHGQRSNSVCPQKLEALKALSKLAFVVGWRTAPNQVIGVLVGQYR